MRKRISGNQFLIEQLEQRLLFSADFEPVPLDGSLTDENILVGSSVEETLLPSTAMESRDAVDEEVKRNEIIFIDASIPDHRQLVDDLLERHNDGRSIEVVVLDINIDGIMQISETLGNYQNLDAVHIVSHGSYGVVQLGNDWLMKETLDDYAGSIEGWREALSNEADLLFYGCNLASGQEGQTLMSSLAILTGADVAASDDLTGHADLGGDWDLEYEKGKIDVSIAVSSELQINWDIRLSGAPPTGGYTADDIIPQAQVTQVAGGGGDIIITWKGKDAESNPVTLHSFQYSDDNGAIWYTPSIGDDSNCFSNNWKDNGGAGWSTATTFGAASPHSFTFSTTHGHVNSVHSLSGVDQSDIQVRFKLNDGTSDSAFLISESFRVDNESPTATITGGSYGASTDTLTITGTNFNTIAADSTDITSYVNWNNLTWDINNDKNSTADISFDGSGVSNLTVTNDTTLTLVFTGAKAAAIEANPDYGAAGGDDSLTVKKGFSYDYFGNKANTDGLDRGPLVITGNPMLTAPGAAITYTTLDPATVIDALATVSDADSPNFDSGTLTVSLSSGGTVNDELSILPGGNVTLNGFNVEVSGMIVGTYSGGSGGTNLLIAWNTNSTASNAQEVLRQIAYRNTSATPDTSTRIVDFVITDGDGGTSNIVQQQVNFTAANQAPVITLPGAAAKFAENDATPVIIDPLVTVTDLDSPDFDTGTLTVSIFANGTANDSLSILPGGNVTLNGFNVEVFDVVTKTVGTYSGGTGGTDLIITWNLSSTPAYIAEVLRQIAFSNSSEDPSSNARTIDFILTDGDGGTSVTAQQQVNVLSVNDPPAGTDNTIITPEDTTYTFTTADFGFSDAVESHSFFTVKITTLPAAGTLTNNGVAVNAGDNISVTDINLSRLVFTPATDANGAGYASFTFQVQDDGGSANGGLDLDQSPNTMTIDVTPQNDAPAVTVPGAQSTNEDTALVISGISVSDDDAGGADIEVTLSVLNGTLTVNDAVAGGLAPAEITNNGTASVVLTGTVAQINATLADAAGLSYLGNFNYNGGDTLTVAADDLGNTGAPGAQTDSQNVDITVNARNDAPAVTVPGAQSTNEDTALVISGISVSDDDAGGADIEVTLTVLNGTLTVNDAVAGGLAPAEITNNGTASVVLTGTVAQINTTLADAAGLSYLGNFNYNGGDTLTVAADDLGNTGAPGAQTDSQNVDITVNARNDAPVLDNTGDMKLTNVIENDTNPPGNSVATIISIAGGDRITDVDSGSIEGIAVIGVDNTNGTWEYFDGGWISFASQGVQNDGSTNDALALLLDQNVLVRFVPDANYDGPAGDITFRAWDQTSGANYDAGVDTSGIYNGGTTAFSTATETATLTVVPGSGVTNLAPSSQITSEENDLIFSVANGNSISVNDGSAGDPTLRITLSVTNGILRLATSSGLTFESGGDGTAAMTFVGPKSAINTALDGLTFTPVGNYSGPANLQIKTDLLADIAGYYTFDNPADPGKDNSPAGTNDAVNVNGATPVIDATRGNVLAFDGNDYVRINGLFGSPSNVTLAAWVNMDAGFVIDDVISLGDNVALRLDDTVLGTGVTAFFYDGSAWRHTEYGAFINGTGWHHVAYTFDDTSNEQIIYIDGAPVATTNYSASISYTQGADTYLGRNGNNPTAYLHGKMDDARIYHRVLSANDIANLFQENISDTDSVAITVTEVNDTPVVTGGTVNNLTVAEDSGTTGLGLAGLSYGPGGGSDESGQNLTYEVTAVPPSALGDIVLADGITVVAPGFYAIADIAGMQFKAAPDAVGVATFDFRVTDNGTTDGSADPKVLTQSITITVTEVNDTPVVTGGTVNNLTVAEDSGTTGLGLAGLSYGPGGGSDESGQNLTYEVTAVPPSALGDIVLADGITVVAPGFYAIADIAGMQFKAAPDAVGVATFDFRVTDNGTTDGSADPKVLTQSITITVTEVNDTPVVTGGTVNNLTVAEDSGTTGLGLAGLSYGPGGGSDESGQNLTYEVTAVPPSVLGDIVLADGITVVAPGFYAIADIAGMQFKAAPDAVGVATFDFRVTDNGTTDGSADPKVLTQSITITVTEVNDTPVVTGGTVNNLTVAEDSGTTGLGLAGLSYGPGGGSDESGQNLTYEVTAVPPSALGDIVLADGITVVAPGFYAIADIAGMQFKAAPDAVGVATFDFRVTDNGTTDGSADPKVLTQSITITVTEVNDTPVVTGGTVNNLTVAEDSGTTGLGLAGLSYGPGGGSDESGQNLTYEVTAVPPSALGDIVLADGITVVAPGFYAIADIAGMQFKAAPDAVGVATFDFRVTDNGTTDGSADPKVLTQSITITVTEVNDTPVVTGGTVNNLTVAEDSGTTGLGLAGLSYGPGGGSDESGQNLTYEVTAVPPSALGDIVLADGITVVAPGFYAIADIAGMQFKAAPDAVGVATFDFRVTDNGTTDGSADPKVLTQSITITVTEVNDTPVVTGGTVNNLTVAEDSGTTGLGLAGLSYGPGGGSDESGQNLTYEVTAVPPSALGDIVLADGITVVAPGFYAIADIAGMQFKAAPDAVGVATFDFRVTDNGTTDGSADPKVLTQSITITVTEVNDTPVVTGGTVNNLTVAEDSGTTGLGLAGLSYGPGGGSDESGQNLTYEVTAVPPSALGDIVLADGSTVVIPGVYTLADIQGMQFRAASNANGTATFSFTVTDDGTTDGSSHPEVLNQTLIITVSPVGDTPQVDNIVTLEDTQSGLILINPHPDDGAEVTHFRISNIINGTLYHADGVTQINNGDYITFAEAQAGVRFTPSADSNADGGFYVEASEDGSSVAAQSGKESSTITVTPVGDTPQVENMVTLEDTQSGLIIISPHPDDGAEVTHFRISNIINGTLYHADGVTRINDGDYITYAEAQAGVRFTPSADSNADGGFYVEASENGSVVADQSDAAGSTITVNPVNDAPTAINLSATETYTVGSSLNLVDIEVSDIDSTTIMVTLTLSDPAAGSLSTATSGTVTSSFDPASGVWTASGALADVNKLLAGVVFIPGENYHSNFTIAVSVSDGDASPLKGIRNMNVILLDDNSVDNDSGDDAADPEVEEPAEDVLQEDPVENTGSEDSPSDNNQVNSEAAPSPAASKSQGIIAKIADVARLNLRTIMEGISYTHRSIPFELATSISGQLPVIQQISNDELLIKTYSRLRNSLDALKEETAKDIQFDKVVVGSTIATTTGLSVGYVIWMIRSGMLLTSVLASMPAWQIADPLPILTRMKDDEDSDDDDSLEALLKKGAKKNEKNRGNHKNDEDAGENVT